MSSFDKYRVHELAKDFGMTSKAIAEILTKYATAPKNHMQVLEDSELSLVFEYLTQHNQCATMEDLFKVPEAKPAAKKPEPEPAAPGPEPGKAPAERAAAAGKAPAAAGPAERPAAAERQAERAGQGGKAPRPAPGAREARHRHARRRQCEPRQV